VDRRAPDIQPLPGSAQCRFEGPDNSNDIQSLGYFNKRRNARRGTRTSDCVKRKPVEMRGVTPTIKGSAARFTSKPPRFSTLGSRSKTPAPEAVTQDGRQHDPCLCVVPGEDSRRAGSCPRASKNSGVTASRDLLAGRADHPCRVTPEVFELRRRLARARAASPGQRRNTGHAACRLDTLLEPAFWPRSQCAEPASCW